MSRLLWVNHFAVTPDMAGGTRHIELGRELVRRGWTVTLAASDFHLHQREYTRRPGAGSRAPVREFVDGVEVQWLWASPYSSNDRRRVRNWLSFGWSLLRANGDFGGPDVVIGSTPHLFAALAALGVARRHGVPFVLEVRDLWPESLRVGRFRRGAGYWALWSLARFLYSRAHRIIVLARGVERYLVESGVPREKIDFLPNGVDVSYFAERSSPRERLRLLYAGAHGPANGLDIVLDAAFLLRHEPRVSFVLVGNGPAKEELHATATRLHLTNVQLAEPVAKSAMPRLLAECDAGLMVLKDVPLFSFGVSPNKLFDYWGAALPVVCNVGGEVAGWVRDARAGIQAADGTAAALATAIERLLALSPEQRCAMGASGREWVQREHSRSLLATRLDQALRPLLRQ